MQTKNKKSKNKGASGKDLEKKIKDSCDIFGVDWTRLKDAGYTGEETQRRFTIKNICDFILFHKRTIVFCEAKSRISSLRFDHITQLGELEKKWKPESYQLSGVLVSLDGFVFFCSVPTIIWMMNNIGKKSFNKHDAHQYCLPLRQFVPGRSKEYIDMEDIFTFNPTELKVKCA